MKYNNYKLYPYAMAMFAVILVLSNTIAARLAFFGSFVFAGAVILFPISYILGDVLTEVYGYSGARRIIWVGIAANILMVVVYWITDKLSPVNPVFAEQFHNVLAPVPRIVVASMFGVWCGQFANARTLSSMKIWTKGRYLWTRTIGSTLVGETVDTTVFVILGFAGVVPWTVIPVMIYSGALFKTLYEVIVTPITYAVITWWKKVEGIDTYDYGLNYNPFKLETEPDVTKTEAGLAQ